MLSAFQKVSLSLGSFVPMQGVVGLITGNKVLQLLWFACNIKTSHLSLRRSVFYFEISIHNIQIFEPQTYIYHDSD